MLIHRNDSLMLVADLSYRLRKRTGGVELAASAVSCRSEKMVYTSDALEMLAGFDGGPTMRKWSRHA